MKNFGTKICARCNQEFTKTGPSQKYCPACSKEAYKEYDRARGQERGRKPWGAYNQKGENNNNYKYGCQYKTALEKVECSICGSTENLLIHHIDHNRRNNDVSNLLVLCKRCHQEHHTMRDPKTGEYIKVPDDWKSIY